MVDVANSAARDLGGRGQAGPTGEFDLAGRGGAGDDVS
jgi:hypothetical protein